MEVSVKVSVKVSFLTDQLVQVLPKLVLVHMVDAPQVHLLKQEVRIRRPFYLSSENKDSLKFLVIGSETLGCVKQFFRVKC